MIRDRKEYEVAVEQSRRLLETLTELRETVYPKNPLQYDVLSSGYVSELEAIRSDIDEFLQIRLSAEKEHDVVVRLEGGLLPNNVPSSAVLSVMGGLRRGLQAIVDTLLTDGEKRGGRKQAHIASATDLVLSSVKFGSLTLCLNLPRDSTLWPFEEAEAAKKALKILMETAQWAAVETDRKSPIEHVKDKHLESAALTNVLKICPVQSGPFERVRVSGRFIPDKPFQLQIEARRRIVEVLRKESPRTFKTVEGRLRAIDLDSQAFAIRERELNKPDMMCRFSEELFDSAKRALDKRIRVSGVLRTNARRQELLVEDIEIIDDMEGRKQDWTPRRKS